MADDNNTLCDFCKRPYESTREHRLGLCIERDDAITTRLQRWEAWAEQFIPAEDRPDVVSQSANAQANGCDPHDPIRAAVAGFIVSAFHSVKQAQTAANNLESLARYHERDAANMRAEVDRLRAAVAEMLLASDQCDGRMQVHQAAAKVGAFIKYDVSSGDAADAVEWRQDDRKDGDASGTLDDLAVTIRAGLATHDDPCPNADRHEAQP